MAYAQNIHTTNHGIADRSSALVKDISARFARYKTYRSTLRELGELSSRDLADLGIHRSSIRAIAYEAAYGA